MFRVFKGSVWVRDEEYRYTGTERDLIPLGVTAPVGTIVEVHAYEEDMLGLSQQWAIGAGETERQARGDLARVIGLIVDLTEAKRGSDEG